MRFIVFPLLSLLLFSLPCPAEAQGVRRSIIQEIDRHPEIGAHEVTVDTRWGTVVLTGHVAKETDRIQIEEIARQQEGVKEVDNQLIVDPPRIAAGSALDEMKAALRREPDLRNYSVSITQENDKFILNGQAGSAREADLVERTARRYAGPLPVINKINAPAALTDDQIASRVATALKSDPEVDLSGIDFRVQESRVYFSGHKTNHREIDRILTITLMVPGVKDVRSSVELGR